jgi:DNA-binding transcriptional regulator LsrR (DeoR family)
MNDSFSDDLKTRVCWLYYVEGMTQDEVAGLVGLTRSKVLRILANSRADGTVQIKVSSKMSDCVKLERKLEAQFRLERAIVIPSPQKQEDIPRIIGRELGQFISGAVRADMSIGLGWGHTLNASLTAIEQKEPDGIKVISLLGGLTRVQRVNPSEFAWRVADRLSAECYLMAAPVYAPDTRSREALLHHPGIAEVQERARSLDMAILSVGDLTPDSTFMRYGLLSSAEIVSLEQAGAVGDILCRFVDTAGQVVDHPVNDLVLSADHRELTSTRHIVLASGGWRKVPIIRAALTAMPVSVLITDQTVAERLCLTAVPQDVPA